MIFKIVERQQGNFNRTKKKEIADSLNLLADLVSLSVNNIT